MFVIQAHTRPNFRSTPSWDTAFSSQSFNITFLVINIEADDEEVDQEEVDQDILNEVGEVIPNISFYDDDDEIFIE